MTLGCLECARLRTEIASLRRQYGQDFPQGALGTAVDVLGLTPEQSRIVLTLYYARDYVHSHTLEERLDMDGDCLKTHICRIRWRKGKPFIETRYDVGYRLGAEAREQIEEAIG